MKPIIRNIFTQEIITFTALTALSALIWFAGPYLLIADHYPLLGPEKRFGIIMVLFLGWLLLSLVFSTPTHNKISAFMTPETTKKLTALTRRFQGAIDFFKKTTINKNGVDVNLSHLPWYLLIGPKNSGKTTLLANSNINFILSKHFSQEVLKAIPSSEFCDWWATRDLVLVDIPSTYIQSKEKSNKTSPRGSLHNILWYNLLNLIFTHRKTSALNGIVIALNLPELLQQNNSQQRSILSDIKLRITEIREKFHKNLPCYFIITKCDLLPGFIEFFSESSSDELAQLWGVTLPALRANEKLSDVLTHRFNALINRLNKQLIWRLHQERNPQARTLIKDFPLQMERMKDLLVQFTKALGIRDLFLNGVYFTSAIQTISEDPNTQSVVTINDSNHPAIQILQQIPLLNKPYFIRQLIIQGLFHSPEPAIAPVATVSNPWHRRAIYAASISTILAAATFLGYDFRQGIQQAYAIQNNLTQYQLQMRQSNPQDDHLVKALPLLNSLKDASETSEKKLSHPTKYLAFYSTKSQQTADDIYTKALHTIVLPEIKNNFEKYLRNASDKNPTQIYAVLKAYIMLSDVNNLDINFVINTVDHLQASSLSQQMNEQLHLHLNAALTSLKTPLKIDDNIVSQSRKQLTSLNSVDLAYVILKNLSNNNLDSPIKLGTDTSVFVSKELANQIPNMFTADKFEKIISEEIPTATSEAMQGNSVLGALPATSQDAASLAEHLSTQYITNYIDIWESQLANIKLSSPKNLSELNKTLEILTSNNSPLLQMLQTIQKNTAFSVITSTSPKLQTFNALLTNASNNQNNFLYQMFLSLRELNTLVHSITATNDIGSAAFQVTKQHVQNTSPDAISHMSTLAQQIPDPMKTWLTNMSNQSWTLISQVAAHYVDIAWQKNITPIYHDQIANRFPFARNANQEVSIQDFSRFLGQQGLLASFYQNYLKPFIDDSVPTEWRWRTADHQPLPFKNEILVQLQNAAKIQRAFFPKGDNQPSIEFTLQPVSIAADTKSFNININGQQIGYDKNDAPIPQAMSWPGTNNTTHATILNFVSPANETATDTIKGDWGWFRLVEKATRNVTNRKEISLTFTVNGHIARYALFTQGHLNPFLPMNFSQMQLPDTLL